MEIPDLELKLPRVLRWIDDLLAQHRPLAQRVDSLAFPRLSAFYAAGTLRHAHVVEVDDIPMPPLGMLGLHEFAELEGMQAEGITYRDVYFVRRDRADDEALHFHELVHIVQWRLLGPEQFLLAYASGYARHGHYGSNPLEQIAFELQADFEEGGTPFPVEPRVERHLQQVLPTLALR
jgi:hypothetical protein